MPAPEDRCLLGILICLRAALISLAIVTVAAQLALPPEVTPAAEGAQRHCPVCPEARASIQRLYDKVQSSPAVTLSQEQRKELQALQLVVWGFWGRRRTVRLLHTYLQRNMQRNGGMISQVIVLQRSGAHPDDPQRPWTDPKDVAFIAGLLRDFPQDYTLVLPKRSTSTGFWGHYKHAEAGKLYLKLDDDVVYVREGAIEALLLEHQRQQMRALFLSANVINHQPLSLAHAFTGAVLPFVPAEGQQCADWVLQPGVTDSLMSSSVRAPALSFNNVSTSCWSWECAAVFHYSFLHHARAGTLEALNLRMWGLNVDAYPRWSIHGVLFRGEDIDMPPHTDDEVVMSMWTPQARKQRSVAVGPALIAHFAYGAQRDLYARTNLLLHYEALAKRLNNVTLRPILPYADDS